MDRKNTRDLTDTLSISFIKTSTKYSHSAINTPTTINHFSIVIRLYFLIIYTIIGGFIFLTPAFANTPSITLCNNQQHCHRLTIEIADTQEKRSLGLMYRKQLPEDYGMLFVYPFTQDVSMWMKNTLIPLDILFINEKGNIIHIVENTEPLSLSTISSPSAVKYVLEINAGISKKLGITNKSTVLLQELFK